MSLSSMVKIKINNSYESEPSSGSGSSLIEPNDYHVFDEENMHLPYLLKPPSYDNEVIVASTVVSPKLKSTTVAVSNVKSTPPQLRNSIPFHSSEESPFEGFSDSEICEELNKQELPNISSRSGKLLFSKFYGTIVEENSTNAVDVQLSNEIIYRNSHKNIDTDRSLQDITPSSELSFNGKINSLNTNINVMHYNELPTTSNTVRHSSRLTSLIESSLNTSQQTETFILKKYRNEKSPDIFDDSDSDEEVEINIAKDLKIESKIDTTNIDCGKFNTSNQQNNNDSKSINCNNDTSFNDIVSQSDDNSQKLFQENCKREKELLCRVRKCLAGVPPPPSLTIPQLDLCDEVSNNKEKILNFLSKPVNVENTMSTSSLFKPTHTLEDSLKMPWKDILGVRQHGLCYNLNKASESLEYLSLSVIDRFIGSETASSYRNITSPSSAKKRNIRMKLLTQSPGNRLSHLAKRRAVFSSVNLATTSQMRVGPQILIDKKKVKNKRKGTPKRMTPGSKKKNRKTPSSSARKRLVRCDIIKPGPSRETSKRALFQSPAKQQMEQKIIAYKPAFKPDFANRVEKSKRALFSPDKQSQCSSTSTSQTNQLPQSLSFNASSTSNWESVLKRKRHVGDDSEDIDALELASQSKKLYRGSSDNLTPRALKIKSQSFCIGSGTPSSAGVTLTSANIVSMPRKSISNSTQQLCISTGNQNSSLGGKMKRAHSEMVPQNNSLSDSQRKKLLWAVSKALQERKITGEHENFKQYAQLLAKVVKRIYLECFKEGSISCSETMLRLARKYSYNVIAGRNSDEIYLQAKTDESKRLSSNRLSGYIGPEEYKQLKLSEQKSRMQHMNSIPNIFGSENSINSLGTSLSQSSSKPCLSAITTTNSSMSQSSLIMERLNQDSNFNAKNVSKPTNVLQMPIQQNAALQNSSSKSNLNGLALRENVDCEHRRSAQKNFTGKDQRNMSPYAGGSSGSSTRSALKPQSIIYTDLTANAATANAATAKRQISFDI